MLYLIVPSAVIAHFKVGQEDITKLCNVKMECGGGIFFNVYHVYNYFFACFYYQVPEHMWCPTSLVVNGKETKYSLPEPGLPLNFINSTGLRYEAEEVRQCLLKGTVAFSIYNLHIKKNRDI